MTAREAIKTAALDLFDTAGVEKTSVAVICQRAGVSNGSFFHAFSTKDALAAELLLSILGDYHNAIGFSLAPIDEAEAGIRAILRTHLSWVTGERRKAKFLFQQVRSEWLASIEAERAAENARFSAMIDRWREPLVETGWLRPVSKEVFVAQLLGPVQIMCRAWLGGRTQTDPSQHLQQMAQCAERALVSSRP